MSPWLRELHEAELVGKVPPVCPLSDKSVEWGGLGNKGSCCPGRILSLSAFVTMCVTHQRQSGGTTSGNT